jgi:hypothetical protein
MKRAAKAGRTQRRKLLVFHVGDPKTGSTSIQDALATGRVVVKGERPFYAARLAHNHLLLPFQTLAGEVTDGDADAAKAQVTRAAELIAEADATRSVISAELFYQLDPVSLRKIIDDHFAALADDVRIVAYVRPHHDWITSTFAEALKIGTFFGDLGRFYAVEGRNSNALPYHARFSRWRATFGDRFVLRPFVREALAGKSVVSDFARFALGPGRFSVSGSPPSNESLAASVQLQLPLMNEVLFFPMAPSATARRMTSMYLATPSCQTALIVTSSPSRLRSSVTSNSRAKAAGDRFIAAAASARSR